MAEQRSPDHTATDSAAEEPSGVVESAPGEATLALEQRARLAEDRLAEVLAAYRQMKADTEKHRDRLQKNFDRRFEQRHERLLLKFIEVLDNLDRALEAAQISYAGQPLLEGMILVRTQLLQVLKDEGLERIPVLGLPFDPHVAEAVGTLPTGEPDQQGIVLKELQRGYRVKGRIARPGRVVIGEYVEGYVAPEHPSHVVDEVIDNSPPTPPAEIVEDAPLAENDDGPSLEEIVARAEAQDALFAPRELLDPEAIEDEEPDPAPEDEGEEEEEGDGEEEDPDSTR